MSGNECSHVYSNSERNPNGHSKPIVYAVYENDATQDFQGNCLELEGQEGVRRWITLVERSW